MIINGDMQVKVISFADFANTSWKVERYLSDGNEHTTDFKYPLLSIGEVTKIRSEAVDPKKNSIKGLKYIGLENVEGLTGEFIPGEKDKSISSVSKRFYPNDILYGRLRPYLNKVFLADTDVTEGICSNEFIVITCSKDILPLYLKTILTSPLVHSKVSAMQAGAALPRINASDLMNLKIPVPPIEVQRQLVKRMEARRNEYRAAVELVKNLPNQTIVDILTELQ